MVERRWAARGETEMSMGWPEASVRGLRIARACSWGGRGEDGVDSAVAAAVARGRPQ